MDVVVLGAGYAGLTVASHLETHLPDDATLTVVDERDTHLVQHLLHRVVREPAMAAEIQIPITDLLDRATHRRARVEAVDPGAGRVSLADGDLDYDLGVVCLGARTDDHGLPGVAEYGQPLKRVEHAETIRERFLSVSADGGRVVVGGAGPAGVQVAGELAELAAAREASVDLEVIEQRETILPSFPRQFRTAVRSALEERGVTVRTGATVERASETALSLEGGATVGYDQFVWTGGITGQAAMDGRRPSVRATLQWTDRTFLVGDAGRVIDEEGTVTPASAQTAIAQAHVAARNVVRLAEHGDGGFRPRLDRYRCDPRGWLVSVGDASVAQVGPVVLEGPPARLLKETVGLGYLGSIGEVRRSLSLLRAHLPT